MTEKSFDSQLGRIKELSPEAQDRIADSLKASIDSELSASSMRNNNPAASFSRGILFSKAGAAFNSDEVILPALQEMDDAKFKAFTSRLAELQKLAGKSAPQ